MALAQRLYDLPEAADLEGMSGVRFASTAWTFAT